MNRWQIGDVRITRIVEMEVAGGTRFILPQATPEAVSSMQWFSAAFCNPRGQAHHECACPRYRNAGSTDVS